MEEYASEAVVLRREPQGEADSRISFFTKKYGKLVAKARSARKITSKLSAHLEPGMVSEIRLVEKNGMLIVDALKRKKLSLAPATLYFLDRILAEADPDMDLWQMLQSDSFSWHSVLGLLGWDPKSAVCGSCAALPSSFHIGRQDFLCVSCSRYEPQKNLIVLNKV
ncbi:MAG: DNA repair protein RecO [Patescibacteria group bacterium]|nr:DNA repair protein RecO [Patescibacteria group bacterium]